MKKWIIVLVVVVLMAAAAAYFFGPFRGQSNATAGDMQTVPAEMGDLTSTIGATGVVRADQTAILLWQTSGTVDFVNIQVGEAVTKGQILAALEQTSLPQNVIMAQADLVSAQKALGDLLNSQLQQALALQAVEDAEQALEDAQNPELAQARALEAIAQAEKALENAERSTRWAKSPASQSFIDEAEAELTLAKDRLDKAYDKYKPYQGRPEDNVTRAVLLAEYSAAKQVYDAAVRKLNSLQGTASITDIAVQEANLATAKAQLLEAQRDWERVKDGPSDADIKLFEAQLEDAKREYERIKDGPDPDDIAVAEARVAAAQATVNQTRLDAPFTGVVTAVESKPGDQVSPGTPAFRLDDNSRLLVDVQVSEVDINRINENQDVILTFDAILDREYQGVVTDVALVGATNQGVVDFVVSVELIDPDESVKPGMTAAVNIVADQMNNVLLVPNRAVRILEGERVVYILKDGQPEPVMITLGSSSETMSEIIEGDLAAGDLIILNPPTIFDQNGPPPFVTGGS